MFGESGGENKPRSGVRLPLFANGVLVVVTAGILWGAAVYFTDQVRVAVAKESRFLTTEWRLLAALKERTDEELEAKDREIALLRRQYSQLVRSGVSPEQRREITDALAQAYRERDDILETRLRAPELLRASAARAAEEGFEPDDGPLAATSREDAPPRQEDAVEAQDGGDPAEGERESPPPQTTSVDAVARFPEVLSANDVGILAWYRGILDDLADGSVAQAEERLDRATGTEVTLGDTDRTRLLRLISRFEQARQYEDILEDVEGDLDRANRRIASLQEEREEQAARGADLAGTVERLRTENSDLSARLRAVEQQLSTEVAAARNAGRAGGQGRALSAVTLLLEYLTGGEVGDEQAARERLIDLWNEEAAYRELMVRTQRLARSGIARDRADLPTPLLVGIVTNADGRLLRAESITSVAVSEGDAVEVRSRSESPPGRLLAHGTVRASAGSVFEIQLSRRRAGEGYEAPGPDDLVYVINLD